VNPEEYDLPKKGNKIKVDVEVNSKQFEEMVKEKTRLEQELEAERTEKESLESKLKIVAEKRFEEKRERLGAPDSIRTIDELKEWEESQRNREVVGRGGSGSLSLEGNLRATGQLKDGFDSQEALVEFLVDQKHMGTPQERKNAEAILNKLYEKTYKGLKEGTGKTGTIFVDNPKERGESIIMKALRKNNERLAKKAMERRGIKE